MNWINSALLQDIFPCSFGSCLTYIEAQRTGWKGPQGVIYFIPLPQGRITCPLCSASSLKTSNKCNFTASLDNLFQCQLPLPLKVFLMPEQDVPCCPSWTFLLVPSVMEKSKNLWLPPLQLLHTWRLFVSSRLNRPQTPEVLVFKTFGHPCCPPDSGQWPTSFLNCSTKIGWSLPAEAFPARCGWKWFCVAVRVRDRTPGYYIPSAFVNLL